MRLGFLTKRVVQRTGDRWWEAELSRLKGTLLVRQSTGHTEAAEACFHQALAMARRHQTKALELRAALSLACLWQQLGKCDAARELLAPIYSWFTEGFDTADLQEAKALLEDLSSGGAGPRAPRGVPRMADR